MAEDSTRRLLKVFGVAVTDCEDAVTALTAALQAPGSGQARSALEAYGKAARELSARWLEVSRLVLDFHARAEAAVQAHFESGEGR
jgi:hypothetical protein